MKVKLLIIAIAVISVLVIFRGHTHKEDVGNQFLVNGKYQDAIAAYQTVIVNEPNNIPCRLGLSQAYLAVQDYSNAETMLESTIKIDQNNLQAREKLFQVYVKEDKLEKASNVLKEITNLNPKQDVKQLTADLHAAKSKTSYDNGITQKNKKQYLEAVYSFQGVMKEDVHRYADAQVQIKECKQAYINDGLQKAKDAMTKKDYKLALEYLNPILALDRNNRTAQQLKNNCVQQQNKQR